MAEELEGNFVSSYNLQTETPLVIDNMIYSLEPQDLPMLTGVGANGLPVLSSTPTADTIFYWMEERAPLPRGTCAEAIDSSETVIDMTTGDAVKFAVGDTVRIDDENMLITDLDTTAETITVTRAYAGTSAATHANGSEVIGVGTVLPEGDVGSSNFVGRDKYSNYTQIWSKTLRMTGTEQVIRKYGIPSELAHQMVKQTQNLYLGMEQSALYGIKYQDTATRKRQTGGLHSWITTNVDSTTDWLTIGAIQDQQQAVYDLGGMFTHIVARPKAFDALNNLDGSERITSVSIDDSRRGRREALTVMTDFGVVNLIRDRWVRATEAFAYSPDRFTRRVLRPMQVQRLAKTDDTDTFLLICEAGYMLKGQVHCAKWTGLDTSAALPSVLV